jgi:hypothetical protein
MIGNRCLASIDVLELTVRIFLANLIETEVVQNAHRLVRLENGSAARSEFSDRHCLGADKLCFQSRFSILEQHGYHLAQVVWSISARPASNPHMLPPLVAEFRDKKTRDSVSSVLNGIGTNPKALASGLRRQSAGPWFRAWFGSRRGVERADKMGQQTHLPKPRSE